MASAEKFRMEESVGDFNGLFKREDSRAHAKHVRIVVLSRERRGFGIAAQPCADTLVDIFCETIFLTIGEY